MPVIFTDTPTAPGSGISTNASTNTESGAYSLKAGASRGCAIQAVFVQGRAAQKTNITGIAFRGKYMSTGSTGGAAGTSQAKNRDFNATCAHTNLFGTTAITLGTPGTLPYGPIFGCGAGGPGGWAAQNPDSVLVLAAGATPSYDIVSICGEASQTFEMSVEVME